MPRVELLQRGASEKLPKRGEASRPAAAYHRLRQI